MMCIRYVYGMYMMCIYDVYKVCLLWFGMLKGLQ